MVAKHCALLLSVLLFAGCGSTSGGEDGGSDPDAGTPHGDPDAGPECLPDDSAVEVFVTPDGTRFVRTPDARFEGLDGYPFAPRYVEVDGLRYHYVDEGPVDGEVVLMLHGQPTWSYLYRRMIPILVSAGHRVIAVDQMGMGRSDKPVDIAVHTYEQHVRWIRLFIEALDLREVTLFVQDWGGLIGLRVAGEDLARYARIVVANSRLPVIPPGLNPFRYPEDVSVDCSLGSFARPAVFQEWIEYALRAPNLTPSEVVEALTVRELTESQAAGYDAPYPSYIHKAAIRAFPSMVTGIADQNRPAWEALGTFERPFLTLAGELDLNLGSEAVQNELIAHVPGAAGQPHDRFEAHHFIQEDIGELLAERVVAFMEATPLP